MRLFPTVGLSLLLTLSSACTSVSGLPAVSTANANQYRLAPGDELRVIVPGMTEIENGTAFVVNDRGELSLPLMGGIPASGSTIPELEQRIATDPQNGRNLVRLKLYLPPPPKVTP